MLKARTYVDLPHAQRPSNAGEHIYNHERPHEALGLHTPACRYRASPRSCPSTLPSIEYRAEDIVSTVSMEWLGPLRTATGCACPKR